MQLSHDDLMLVLALVRGGTLARAAALLQVDVTTVFRGIRRLEQGLGSSLFEKGRSGYLPGQVALRLAEQAERAEQALAAAQLAVLQERDIVSGTVRLTCTDTVLHGLLQAALARFMPKYPALRLELIASNDFANLSRHEADVALRLTRTPPEHLVGRCLGEVPYQLCGHADYLRAQGDRPWPEMDWIAPDDFLPDHASVQWRRQHYPGVQPRFHCNSLLSAASLARAGLGLTVLPGFLIAQDLQALTPPLPGCTTQLWLLTRPDCRALRSVSVLMEALAEHMVLSYHPLVVNRH
ncbi:transcriptional regulator [Chitinimonas prasina]|uniref:Transcriptional regulator n=1 Tax=Chitinimonas prasina TaxID=1434937 RepID=A0ABQ5YJB3_9NEIS|nr:LysR family transcriptional regulator [Chitinimonas prasina]GLR13435.1 transcriptional regulator [Chitinimonas prasina]